jgi:hypothetical protein
MAVLTITLGTTDKLQLKVPVKGETNWANSFKTEFAQKIVDHDHTGVDGKGSKIATAALEDLAVTTAKLANNAVDSSKISSAVVEDKLSAVSIDALSDVDTTSTPPSSGQVLKWSGSAWTPGADSTSAGTTVLVVAKLTSGQTDSGIIKFNSVEIDLGTNYSASTGQFTAPSAGYYEVHCEVGFDAYSPTYMTEAHLDDAVQIYKNSSAVYNHLPYLDIRYEGVTQTLVSYNYTYIVNLAQNDIITIRTKDLTGSVNDTLATAPSLVTIKKL